MRIFAKIAAAALLLAPATSYATSEYDPQLEALAHGELAVILSNDLILQSLRDQNAAHAGLSQADIDSMDKKWRAEVGTSSRPMIDTILGTSTSAWLQQMKDSTGGLVTEVFVVDNRGLNVAQSDVTSDYWQGDEAKWQKTYGKPVGTVHLGDVELDESSQSYQSQISMPIHDPITGAPLGSVTVGVNLEYLQ